MVLRSMLAAVRFALYSSTTANGESKEANIRVICKLVNSPADKTAFEKGDRHKKIFPFG